MSYFRRNGMSDAEGPITSPSQVDDDLGVAIVPPTRVSCDALPVDSPWRKPGQVCAPPPPSVVADFFRGLMGKIQGIAPPDAPPSPPPPTAPSSTPTLLVLAAAGGLGYYLYTRKRKRV